MEKQKWWVKVLKAIGLTAIGMILKNQKGIKGTDNTELVDIAVNEIKKDLD